MNQYLINPLLEVNCKENIQSIIQNKIFNLWQSQKETEEYQVYREIFETTPFSYSSKEELIKHGYIYKFISPRSLSYLQELTKKQLKIVLNDSNF